MPKAKATPWAKSLTQTQANSEASSYAVDVRLLHYCVNDTLVQRRGFTTDDRPGDVALRLLHGHVFHRG